MAARVVCVIRACLRASLCDSVTADDLPIETLQTHVVVRAVEIT